MGFKDAFPKVCGSHRGDLVAWAQIALVALVLLSLFAAGSAGEVNNTTSATNVTSSSSNTATAAAWGVLVTVIGAGLRAAYGRWQNAHEVTDFRQIGMTLAIGFISGVVLGLLAESGDPTLALYTTNPMVALLVGVVATDVVETILKGTIRRLPDRLVADAGPLLTMLLKQPKPTPPPDKDVEAVVSESEPATLGSGKSGE